MAIKDVTKVVIQPAIVRIVCSTALSHLSKRVAQRVRDQYEGKTENETSSANKAMHRVSVTLTHSCGTHLMQFVLVDKVCNKVHAEEKGVRLAEKLITSIEHHQRTCNDPEAPKRNESLRGLHHDNVVPIKSVPVAKVCEICGEQDLTKYPKWPECEHVRKKEEVRPRDSVPKKHTSVGKGKIHKSASKVRRTKDQTAKG